MVVNVNDVAGTVTSSPLPVRGLRLEGPIISDMTPLAASRGQWIELTGKGFTAPDGLLQVATILLLEGQFQPRLGGPLVELRGPNALTLVPDRRPATHSWGRCCGWASTPMAIWKAWGFCRGRLPEPWRPWSFSGADSTKGRGLPITFEVLPQRQVIYLKLLPAFESALAEFGLLLQKEAIKARVLEVLQRDYANVSITFTYEVPTAYAEYGVVEIAGRDPNGTGLFGLDNTSGKDIGNLRFDDIVGGFNADTQSMAMLPTGASFRANS